MRLFFYTVVCLFVAVPVKSQENPAIEQVHPAIGRFLDSPYMNGASVSIMVKNMSDGSIICSYDADREVIPASVMKIVTTATALEILEGDFRYETSVMYDGQITDSVLNGNIYICGSGDPTTGSADLKTGRDSVMKEWVAAIKKAGIRKIIGAVIADESIFDTEGISMKWLREDLGSNYGQGCYGLNVFDNRYSLFLNTGKAESKPDIAKSDPDMSSILFRNYLTTSKTAKDSSYIIGFPYSNERYLYGTVPENRHEYRLGGDIPEPALFLAQYINNMLKKENITVIGNPSCHRILSQSDKWNRQNREVIVNTYSPPLKEVVGITNHESNNLFADALLKTVGLKYKSDEKLSSFDKGIKTLNDYWNGKGLNTSSLWMYDGSGLALTDKTTAKFLCEILTYMATESKSSDVFVRSIPRAGIEGTVRSTLNGTVLQGKIRLKSGSMSRVRSYAGYMTDNNRQFALAIMVNNFSCKQAQIKNDIEQLLLSLFNQ
ncbi:MAG: D-alanyl-D-alanine carboxypeptidase/D-alanyl-D-alanine-endopeptidase [Tannerella sp.]|jgi:D-alanyl-D-alanine carboxypeptidase/D-alanyl-D-alanine-endopeptidase (penicillin-binding protein 4)|nr:D-alanyl-D-alanine carboxypeptidase/D-alanyl-D-alanine-endopeptidase [Tannerella sp.]